MSNVQLPGSNPFDTQIAVQSATQNTDVSLTLEFQKHLSNESRKHGIIYYRKFKEVQVSKSGQTVSIMCIIIKMFSIRM